MSAVDFGLKFSDKEWLWNRVDAQAVSNVDTHTRPSKAKDSDNLHWTHTHTHTSVSSSSQLRVPEY